VAEAVPILDAVASIDRAVREGRYLDVLRTIASLPPEQRSELLRALDESLRRAPESPVKSVDEFIYAIAKNAVLLGENPVEVLELVRNIQEEIYSKLLKELPDILLGLGFRYAEEGKFDKVSRVKEWARQLGFDNVVKQLEAVEHPELYKLITTVAEGRWDEAYELLREVESRNLVDDLRSYLEAQNISYEDFRKTIIANATGFNRFAEYVTKKDWMSALRHIASLDPEKRRLLLDLVIEQLSKEGVRVSPDDVVLNIAANAYLATKNFDDVYNTLRSISEDLAKRFEEQRIVIDLISDKNVVDLLNAVRNGEWEKAYELLNKIREKGLIDELLTYLEKQGIDPRSFVLGIELGYIANLVEKAKSPEEVIDILRKFADRLPEDIRKVLGDAEIVAELSRLAETRDIEGATKLIDSLPEDQRRVYAGIFLLLLSRAGVPPELVDRVAEFARRYGIDVRTVEITREDLELAVQGIDERLATTILSEIGEAIRARDIKKLEELKERYRDVLEATVKGRKLVDIIDGAITYARLRDAIENINSVVGELNEYVRRYFEDRRRGKDVRFDYDLSKIDRALEDIERLEKAKDRLLALEDVVIDGVDRFFEGLPRMKAFLLYAKALHYFDRNDKRALDFIEEASRIDPAYREVAVVMNLALEPRMEEVECILREAGVIA